MFHFDNEAESLIAYILHMTGNNFEWEFFGLGYKMAWKYI